MLNQRKNIFLTTSVLALDIEVETSVVLLLLPLMRGYWTVSASAGWLQSPWPCWHIMVPLGLAHHCLSVCVSLDTLWAWWAVQSSVHVWVYLNCWYCERYRVWWKCVCLSWSVTVCVHAWSSGGDVCVEQAIQKIPLMYYNFFFHAPSTQHIHCIDGFLYITTLDCE